MRVRCPKHNSGRRGVCLPFPWLFAWFRNHLRGSAVTATISLACLAPTFVLSQEANVRLGPVDLDLVGSGGVEYHSNINDSGADPRWDVVTYAGLSMSAVWEMTRYNELRMRMGARYNKYIRHPELDSHRNFLILTPETELSFQVRIGEIEVELFDRVEFSSSATDVRALEPETGEVVLNILSYNRLVNTVGGIGRWELNPYWRLSFGGDRLDVVPWENAFKSLRRWQHTGRVGLHHDLAANMNLAALATVFTNTYRLDLQPDSQGFTLGGEVSWAPTELTSLTATVAWTELDFEERMEGGDEAALSRLTGTLAVRNALNRFYNHEVHYARDIDFGFISNATTSDSMQYRAFFLGLQQTRVEGQLGWSRGRDSGGIAPERFTRWESGVNFIYSFVRDMRGNLGYRYTTKSSNFAERSYSGHSVSLGFTYDF